MEGIRSYFIFASSTMFSIHLFGFVICIFALVVAGYEEACKRNSDSKMSSRRIDFDIEWHRALDDIPTSGRFAPKEGEPQCPVCGTPPDYMCPPNGNMCHEIYSPVCGCDGVTYSNRCVATVLHCVPCVNTGECPDPSF